MENGAMFCKRSLWTVRCYTVMLRHVHDLLREEEGIIVSSASILYPSRT